MYNKKLKYKVASIIICILLTGCGSRDFTQEALEQSEIPVSAETTLVPELNVSPETTLSPELSITLETTLSPEPNVSPEPSFTPETTAIPDKKYPQGTLIKNYIKNKNGKTIKAIIDYTENHFRGNDVREEEYKKGDAITFSQLTEYVIHSYVKELAIFQALPTIEYTYVDCGKDGKKELVIRYMDSSQSDEYVCFVFAEREGGLYLVFDYSYSYRCGEFINRVKYVN